MTDGSTKLTVITLYLMFLSIVRISHKRTVLKLSIIVHQVIWLFLYRIITPLMLYSICVLYLQNLFQAVRC